MFDKYVFGQTLNHLRKEKGLTIQMLAELCNLSVDTIRSYQYARQTPSTKTLLLLCNIFSVTPNRLLQGIYSQPTELDDIAVVDLFCSNRTGKVRQAFDTVYECMLTSVPRLEQADFGSRLRVFREEANLSTFDFAQYSQIKTSTLITMESNQGLPGVDVMLRMCQKLCISPDFFLYKNVNTLFISDKWYRYLTPKQIKCLADLTQYL